MKTVVIGDIHGCIDEFLDILPAADFQRGDRLILLGDLIDRGPDPAAVVSFAKAMNAECVMGNHEEKALRWRRHEKRRKEDPNHYKNPMLGIHQDRLDQWAKISDENWDWISSWPKFIHINDKYVGVHAGCMPDVEIEQQVPNELMRLRYVKSTPTPSGYMRYKMASLTESGNSPNAKEGETIQHWTKLWTGPKSVVYGHYVWDEIHTESNGEVHTLGIDTGCVHGGQLTALSFRTFPEAFLIDITQIKAKKVYSERKPWNEE